MKKSITLFFCICLAVAAFAQAPEAISYQAVARDADGNILINQPVSFRLSILREIAPSMVLYSETHEATTNQFGLATLAIGKGNIITGDFSLIDWSLGPIILQTEMDPAGGTDFQFMGTSEFLAVPYALYSKSAANAPAPGTNGQTLRSDGTSWIPNSALYNDGTNVGIGTTTPGAKLDVAGPIWQTNTGQSVLLGEGTGAYDGFSINENVYVGFYAGHSNTTGWWNTASGCWALYSNTVGTYNTANGVSALGLNTTGIYNTANGINALSMNTTGNSNTANGSNALSMNTTGNLNSALGINADVASGNLTNATAIGAKAQVGASNSLVLGSIGGVNGAHDTVKVGIGTTTPSARLDIVGNVKITDGSQGANKVLTSDANGLARWQTPAATSNAWLLTGNTGSTNFIGTTDNNPFDIYTNNVLKTRITTNGQIETYNTGQSVFLGEGAGAADNLTDNYNVFIGYKAGNSNITGIWHTASGYEALASNTNGERNTATGYKAMLSNTSGSENTADGANALYANTTGNFNTAFGKEALFSNVSGSKNTAIGYGAMTSSVNFNNATAIGAHALAGASNSLVLGSIAQVNGATQSVNVGIGTTTPSARLDVVGNVKITDGTQGAGKVLTSDADGLASWQSQAALSNAWSLSGNTGSTNFIGTTDTNSFDIRTNNVLKTRITKKGAIEIFNTGNSIFIGDGAGANDDLNYRNNIFIGNLAGNSNTNGYDNVGIGNYALLSNTSGYGNFASGNSALSNNETGCSNTAIGFYALRSNTAGHENTAIGSNALVSNTTGSCNTAIGDGAGVSSGNLTNTTAIGANARVGQSNSLVLGGTGMFAVDVGIGTTTPSKKLDVTGEIQTTGTGNNYFAGRVGIGTATPSAPLQVTATGTGLPSTNGLYVFNPTTSSGNASVCTRVGGAGAGDPFISLDVNDEGGWSMGIDNSDSKSLSFRNNWDFSGTDRMTLTDGGNVGIGTTSPAQKLDVAGNISLQNTLDLWDGASPTNHWAGIKHDPGNNYLFVFNDPSFTNKVYLSEGGTSWIGISDIRLKKDIEPIAGILDDVCKLKAKKYRMKTEPDTARKRIGFIAQDVQPLFPEVVSNDGHYLGLSYSDFGVISIEAIKELRAEKDAEIAALNQKINILDSQNQGLKIENEKLSALIQSMAAKIDRINARLNITSQK